MRKLLLGALLLAVMAAGCAVTDYPVIYDDRGDFSGIIRTGHKALVMIGQVATIWSDGTDEIFNLVYQNNYGDQKLYSFNNFDPTGSVMFLDHTYCDWRYSGCEITRAWNPHNAAIDNVFDYELFLDCSGARSLSTLVSYTSRYYGECGDGRFNDRQAFMGEFANLATTTFRGEPAYVLGLNAGNASFTFNGTDTAPIFGQYNMLVTNNMSLVVPMTPNMKHFLRWTQDWVSQNGARANVTINYGAVTGDFSVQFAPAGIANNLNRF
ncbi:MAG: hypothetical protein KBD01_15625 [Acidobacteria bacterium]|nr:hypothetical protein [Acidobacteriota bacterium]